MLIRLVLALNDKSLQKKIEANFSYADVQVESIRQTRAAWQKLVRSCGDILVISESLIPHSVESGIALLNSLPEKPTIVVLTDSDSSEEQAQLVTVGADVVLYSRLSVKQLAEAIETTLESRRQLSRMDRFDARGRVKPRIDDFISDSEEMRIFMDEVRHVVHSNSSLLILGETGVGKEHLAKAIHAESSRAAGPMITVNTAALPEQLLESELFGHVQGAFTGAIRSRRGAFELAHDGTLFLDEIGEMPLHLQAKLLRVLQDYEIWPVGGEKPIWVDVRVIAATNHDLEQEVAQGSFRQDLFYRLGVVTLTIPPLRKRKEDIPALAESFLDFHRYRIGRDISSISKPAMDLLCRYDWPGNIRELMNVIERAMLLCQGDEITQKDLPHTFHENHSLSKAILSREADLPVEWSDKTLPQVQQEVLDRVERLYIEMILKRTNGRVGEAAEIAGIHPRGLYNKLRRLNIHKEDFKTAKP